MMKFTKEIAEFIRNNATGVSNKDLLQKVNAEFNTNFTLSQIKNFKARHKISSGLSGNFVKGHTPWNAGKTGWCPKGAEKTWFQKGELPPTARPIGSERVDEDGYTYIKIAESQRWVLKHRYIYEQAHGKIPKEMVVIFLDGDKRNFDITNLKAVTRGQLAIMCRNGMFSKNAEITEAMIPMAQLKIETNKAKRKLQKGKKEDERTEFNS